MLKKTKPCTSAQAGEAAGRAFVVHFPLLAEHSGAFSETSQEEQPPWQGKWAANRRGTEAVWGQQAQGHRHGFRTWASFAS